MKCTIFYSWQSDLPNKDNRSFIENCIEKAIKKDKLGFEAGLTIAVLIEIQRKRLEHQI